MNIPKIEEAITLLYQTFIEDQDVATQRGIAITAMNEMVNLLGGVDVVAKLESVPYSARLRAQHLFEDEPPQRTEQEPVAIDWERIAKVQNAKLMAMCDEADGFEKLCEVMNKYKATHPPQRKPLTDKVLNVIASQWHMNLLVGKDKADVMSFARAIEAAHGIKE